MIGLQVLLFIELPLSYQFFFLYHKITTGIIRCCDTRFLPEDLLLLCRDGIVLCFFGVIITRSFFNEGASVYLDWVHGMPAGAWRRQTDITIIVVTLFIAMILATTTYCSCISLPTTIIIIIYISLQDKKWNICTSHIVQLAIVPPYTARTTFYYCIRGLVVVETSHPPDIAGLMDGYVFVASNVADAGSW